MATIDESTLVGCPQELLERGNQTLDLPLGGFESLGITKDEFDEYPIVEFPMKLDIAPAFFISVATACKHAFPFDDDQDFYLDYISDRQGWAARLAPSVVMYLGKSRLRIRGRTLFTTVTSTLKVFCIVWQPRRKVQLPCVRPWKMLGNSVKRWLPEFGMASCRKQPMMPSLGNR